MANECKTLARSMVEDLTAAFREAIEAAALNHRIHAHASTFPKMAKPQMMEQLKKHKANIEGRLTSARQAADGLGRCWGDATSDRDAIFEEVESLEEKHDTEVEQLDERVDVVEEELGIEGEDE
jgi:hypothetical protein